MYLEKERCELFKDRTCEARRLSTGLWMQIFFTSHEKTWQKTRTVP